MTPRPETAGPGCCELGDANLAWFAASKPAGAWHPSSFRWDPRVDAPISEPLEACPFCGRRLPVPGGDRARTAPEKAGQAGLEERG